MPISLGEFGAIGGGLMIGGAFRPVMHMSLYKMHELAQHGLFRPTSDTLARRITRRTDRTSRCHVSTTSKGSRC
ncbi:MAG: hypothetical protein ABI330_21710 [Caldimonas sp.]